MRDGLTNYFAAKNYVLLRAHLNQQSASLIENVDLLWFHEFFSFILEIIIFALETEIRKCIRIISIYDFMKISFKSDWWNNCPDVLEKSGKKFQKQT